MSLRNIPFRLGSVAVALVLSACAGSGSEAPQDLSGPKAAFDPPEPGFTAKIGGLPYELTEVEGHNLVFAANDQYVTALGGLHPIWNLEQRSLEFPDDPMASLWPLQVGKTANFDVYDPENDVTYNVDATVLRREEVTVPAGTFDTYVVRVEQEIAIRSDFASASLFYFAPKPGVTVKRDHTVKRGNQDDLSYEVDKLKPVES